MLHEPRIPGAAQAGRVARQVERGRQSAGRQRAGHWALPGRVRAGSARLALARLALASPLESGTAGWQVVGRAERSVQAPPVGPPPRPAHLCSTSAESDGISKGMTSAPAALSSLLSVCSSTNTTSRVWGEWRLREATKTLSRSGSRPMTLVTTYLPPRREEPGVPERGVTGPHDGSPAAPAAIASAVHAV